MDPLINRIIAAGSAVLAKIKASQPIDILKLIINPFIYVDKYDRTQKKSLDTIGEVLEPLCRQLSGGGSRGDAPGARPPPPKIGKNMIFWRKIVVFHTKYPNNFRASLRSAQFF
jgi:hypothetical protein